MQTILGANGQIGRELALSLRRDFTSDIRLVSRNPQKVNDTDQLFQADLLDPEQTLRAVEGSETVYLTAGLPMNTQLWVAQWPTLMRNVIAACETHGAKLVYFDNTYMYPQTNVPQHENTPFQPNDGKGNVRALITRMLLEAMEQGRVNAVICRAPEFYGPGKTQSITNSTIIDSLLGGKTAKVFLRDDVKRSLIYTPDASRAMALLGNTPDAYGQTWHLPCDDNRLTYSEFATLAATTFGAQPRYRVLKQWQLWLAGKVSPTVRDAAELLPRYKTDNIFVSDKFKQRFPAFQITTFEQGLHNIWLEHQAR
ncbi:NAD-dependent epimerase/dehydratase family protein [Vibrio fluvialis]|nr:NAD-dependent epimerase/dehydratase family protein [Vibrio fluvialis]ELS3717457.1 NAD-dependent epimerase/dehydratase family protein [Vibrio fluvialis]ELX9690558.1 NAD-dependent epimerase/dehydratase family protein [Vibrio fluvialis]ELX9694130.1 NAD-dependent epimerase/dehydratase family protein [Vibrio fluvialis]